MRAPRLVAATAITATAIAAATVAATTTTTAATTTIAATAIAAAIAATITPSITAATDIALAPTILIRVEASDRRLPLGWGRAAIGGAFRPTAAASLAALVFAITRCVLLAQPRFLAVATTTCPTRLTASGLIARALAAIGVLFLP